jgi:2'-5' RNA ligase
MLSKYALVIVPPAFALEAIRHLKEQLYQEIGSYKDYQNEAHLTFSIFQGKAATALSWQRYIEEFSTTLEQKSIGFNKIVGFSNGSLVLLPDEESYTFLLATMKAFHKNKPAAPILQSAKPHITIARKLTATQLEKAIALFSDVNIQFEFSTLMLKQFSKVLGRFENYKSYDLPFTN